MIPSRAVQLRRSCLRLPNLRSICCGETGTMADSSLENAVHSQKGKDQEEESIQTKIEAEDIEKIIADKIGNPPEKPLPGDCCGSGCETCVWDIYFDDLKRYNDEKDALLKSLSPSHK